MPDSLPEVAGPMTVPPATLADRARVLIADEQSRPNADSALLGVLADTVRMARAVDAMTGGVAIGSFRGATGPAKEKPGAAFQPWAKVKVSLGQEVEMWCTSNHENEWGVDLVRRLYAATEKAQSAPKEKPASLGEVATGTTLKPAAPTPPILKLQYTEEGFWLHVSPPGGPRAAIRLESRLDTVMRALHFAFAHQYGVLEGAPATDDPNALNYKNAMLRLHELVRRVARLIDPECPDIEAYLDGRCSLEEGVKRLVDQLAATRTTEPKHASFCPLALPPAMVTIGARCTCNLGKSS